MSVCKLRRCLRSSTRSCHEPRGVKSKSSAELVLRSLSSLLRSCSGGATTCLTKGTLSCDHTFPALHVSARLSRSKQRRPYLNHPVLDVLAVRVDRLLKRHLLHTPKINPHNRVAVDCSLYDRDYNESSFYFVFCYMRIFHHKYVGLRYLSYLIFYQVFVSLQVSTTRRSIFAQIFEDRCDANL